MTLQYIVVFMLDEDRTSDAIVGPFADYQTADQFGDNVVVGSDKFSEYFVFDLISPEDFKP